MSYYHSLDFMFSIIQYHFSFFLQWLRTSSNTYNVIYNLFLPYTNPDMTQNIEENPLTPAILCRDGLTGAPDSQAKRDAVGATFGLPGGMNAKAFLAAVKCVATYEEYEKAIKALEDF